MQLFYVLVRFLQARIHVIQAGQNYFIPKLYFTSPKAEAWKSLFIQLTISVNQLEITVSQKKKN